MSTPQVKPPAARARVPLPQPSQAARPGSLKWTWASIRPGRMSSPCASIDLARVVSERAGRLERGDHAVGERDLGRLAADDRVEAHAALLR